MNTLDYYDSVSMDASVVLNYPKGMPGVLSSLVKILEQQKKYVVEYDNLTVDDARRIVRDATGSKIEYHLIASADPQVWGVLRNAVEQDDIRVLGVFHGQIPEEVPENVITIDIGRSLHRKVSKQVVAAISEALSKKGNALTGNPEQLYYGIMTLCYEVLYRPEYVVFPRNLHKVVFVSTAFDYMYNPPQILDTSSMRNAVQNFVEAVHGDMD